jgi:hypothetical protein
MASLKLPYYDKRKTYSESYFTQHKMQKYIALFLSKPELYEDVLTYPNEYKEIRFMFIFRNFAEKYINIDYEKNVDISYYFMSLNIDKKGSMDICGGAKMSNTGRKQFLKEYSEGQEANMKIRKYLSEKYKLNFNPALPDPRIFIGHHEIWINPSPELLKLEGWDTIIYNSYDDPDFKNPFPEELDGDLIPLAIRNKSLQKWKNEKRRKYEIEDYKRRQLAISKHRDDEEEDEDKELKLKASASSNQDTLKLKVLDTSFMKDYSDDDW